jgi:hypothetical protein
LPAEVLTEPVPDCVVSFFSLTSNDMSGNH